MREHAIVGLTLVETTNQRLETRLNAEAAGLRARSLIRPGVSAHVLNISGGGALVESSVGIAPGSERELLLTVGHEQSWVKCRVLRSWVANVRPLRYRIAVVFDEERRTAKIVTANDLSARPSNDEVELVATLSTP